MDASSEASNFQDENGSQQLNPVHLQPHVDGGVFAHHQQHHEQSYYQHTQPYTSSVFPSSFQSTFSHQCVPSNSSGNILTIPYSQNPPFVSQILNQSSMLEGSFYQLPPPLSQNNPGNLPSSSLNEPGFSIRGSPMAPLRKRISEQYSDPTKPARAMISAKSTIYSFVPLPGAQQQKRPRKRYDEIVRIYHCNFPNCSKAYGTLNHLNAHVTMQKHGPRRTPDEFKATRRDHKARKKLDDKQKLVLMRIGTDESLSKTRPSPFGKGINQTTPELSSLPGLAKHANHTVLLSPLCSLAKSGSDPTQFSLASTNSAITIMESVGQKFENYSTLEHTNLTLPSLAINLPPIASPASTTIMYGQNPGNVYYQDSANTAYLPERMPVGSASGPLTPAPATSSLKSSSSGFTLTAASNLVDTSSSSPSHGSEFTLSTQRQFNYYPYQLSGPERKLEP